MTASDDSRDESGKGTPEGGADPQADAPIGGDHEPGHGAELPSDFEDVFRDIVAHYGERPTISEPVHPPREAPHQPPRERPTVDPTLFDRRHLDPDEAPVRPEREEHFVPPEPPPVPRGTPARRLAWLGLFVPPLLMLAAVAFGWTFAGWFSMMLVAGFVGGFVFLVATMPRDRGEDGDDGAVV